MSKIKAKDIIQWYFEGRIDLVECNKKLEDFILAESNLELLPEIVKLHKNLEKKQITPWEYCEGLNGLTLC